MKRITAVSACGIFALAGWSISFAMARPTAPVVLQEDVKQVKGPYAERLVAEVTAAGG